MARPLWKRHLNPSIVGYRVPSSSGENLRICAVLCILYWTCFVVLPLMTLGDSRVESRSLSRQAPSSKDPGAGCGASRDATMSARSMFFRAMYRLSTVRKHNTLRSDDSSKAEFASNPTHPVSPSLGRVWGWKSHHFYWCEGQQCAVVTTLRCAAVFN